MMTVTTMCNDIDRMIGQLTQIKDEYGNIRIEGYDLVRVIRVMDAKDHTKIVDTYICIGEMA